MSASSNQITLVNLNTLKEIPLSKTAKEAKRLSDQSLDDKPFEQLSCKDQINKIICPFKDSNSNLEGHKYITPSVFWNKEDFEMYEDFVQRGIIFHGKEYQHGMYQFMYKSEERCISLAFPCNYKLETDEVFQYEIVDMKLFIQLTRDSKPFMIKHIPDEVYYGEYACYTDSFPEEIINKEQDYNGVIISPSVIYNNLYNAYKILTQDENKENQEYCQGKRDEYINWPEDHFDENILDIIHFARTSLILE